jgi:hypothetical protein
MLGTARASESDQHHKGASDCSGRERREHAGFSGKSRPRTIEARTRVLVGLLIGRRLDIPV